MLRPVELSTTNFVSKMNAVAGGPSARVIVSQYVDAAGNATKNRARPFFFTVLTRFCHGWQPDHAAVLVHLPPEEDTGRLWRDRFGGDPGILQRMCDGSVRL